MKCHALRRAARAGRTSPWRAPRSSVPPASRRRARRAARPRARSPGSTSGAGKNSVACRLPSVIVPVLSSSSTLTSPAASTARPDIASTLCCSTRSMPAIPIAESRPPIVVGIRQTRSAIRTGVVAIPAGVERERPQRHGRDQEDDRQTREQDRERDLVGRLLTRGAFDESDHPVEEGLARIRRDLDDDAVRENARAARHRRPVAAGLADDRGRLAGDRRLVDGRDPLDDRSVARNHLVRPRRRPGRPCAGSSREPAPLPCGSAAARSSPCGRGAGPPPAPCRALRPSPRRSSRRAA